jgi:hypothetical protein
MQGKKMCWTSSLRTGLFVWCALGLFTCGCSPSNRTPVYPVRGQVLLNGKPLARAVIVLHGESTATKDLRPSAQTDSDGRFLLTSFETGDGAPAGAYQVSLTCYSASSKASAVEGDYSVRNVLPARYSNPATSRLRVDVKSGDNELPPFQLVSR